MKAEKVSRPQKLPSKGESESALLRDGKGMSQRIFISWKPKDKFRGNDAIFFFNIS